MKMKFKRASGKNRPAAWADGGGLQELRKVDAFCPDGGRFYEDLVLLALGFYRAWGGRG